ncbi:MAG: MBOAT family protein [Rhodospirillaceae bacterium]|nr:MBOAT family protein [Rhodospirillaceae bacterium]
MVFTDGAFVFVFLPVVWALYGVLMRLRAGPAVVWLLSLASLGFYAYDSIANMGVMLASIGVNYAAGCALCTSRRLPLGRKPIAITAVLLNLALLGYFKYAAFALNNAGALLDNGWSIAALALPLGISFYTFTQIAYVVDCYTERDVDTRFGSYLLFVTFFPHLVAGPIIYHREMMPQFRALGRRAIAWDDIETGLFLFAIGLAKKVLIADVLAEWVDPGYRAAASLGTADAWLLSLAYSLQLYFDFSGYSDMAIGLALLFGIRLPINFASPYRAASVRDFWRRWHITLSRWLRRYLYIPLGGSRGGKAATVRNLMLTFLLGGLWHGAGWGFLVWGLLHGAGCAVGRLVPARFSLPRPLAILITFLFVNAAWVFFRAPDLDTAFAVLAAMGGFSSAGSALAVFAADASLLVPAILVGLAICWLAPNSQALAWGSWRIGVAAKAAYCGATLALFLLMTRGAVPSPFLYFNF